MNSNTTKTPPIRHVEARRTASCGFANRIAASALEVFRSRVGYSQPTCVSAILAYDGKKMTVLSMGVGTKFLPSKHSLAAVRDMHAETLCRRGLRRFLTNEIRSGFPSTVLRKDEESGRFQLQENVTLHLYCSSAPCGNSTIKKFATFKKESYRQDFDEAWPREIHPKLERHSLHLGQCALLLKKNPGAASTAALVCNTEDPRLLLSQIKRSWPMYCSTNWCPPGTTASWDIQHGSIHTCSDKLALWNSVGWQGSLLTPKLVDPIRPVTMTVGRKYSSDTCRRAVCCRLINCPHHISVMGDAVYMDESAAINTALEPLMRFHSKQCWVLWKTSPSTRDIGHDDLTTECINTDTGMLWADASESSVCTLRLIEDLGLPRPNTIAELRGLKESVSPDYETFKKQLLTTDPVLKDWYRRDDPSS